MTRRALTLLCLVAALGTAADARAATAPILEVGQPFPDLALRTLDGEVRRVSDYRGTKLVLHVFASW